MVKHVNIRNGFSPIPRLQIVSVPFTALWEEVSVRSVSQEWNGGHSKILYINTQTRHNIVSRFRTFRTLDSVAGMSRVQT